MAMGQADTLTLVDAITIARIAGSRDSGAIGALLRGRGVE